MTERFTYHAIYKESKHLLIGGKIVDKQWRLSFESNIKEGSFLPLSTHCGFHEVEDRVIVFGPTGDRVALEGCLQAIAEGDKLYTIEKDPTHEDRCVFTIRQLKIDSEVVSPIETTIPIGVKTATFGHVDHNGQVILFANNSPIFVDLSSQKVTHSPHKFPWHARCVVRSDTAELWTWDQISKEIWKVSPSSITLMGSLDGGSGTSLLYVDQTNHLYLD